MEVGWGGVGWGGWGGWGAWVLVCSGFMALGLRGSVTNAVMITNANVNTGFSFAALCYIDIT